MAERIYSTGEVASLVRNNLSAWGVVAVLFCASPATLIMVAIPRFEALLKGFGAELPGATAFLLHWRFLLWIAPALALLLFGFALTTSPEKVIARHRTVVWAFAVLCCVSLVVTGLAVVALYAPIFRLGSVV